MNEQEIILAKIELNQDEIEQNQTDRQKLIDESKKLYNDLEDWKDINEPKLTHGDYGYCGEPSENNMYFIDSQFKGTEDNPFGISNTGGQESINKPICEFKTMGNIFDDLKRNSKNLEKFTNDVHTYRYDFIVFPFAPICIAGTWHTIKEATEFHQKLGQLLATAIRKQAESK